jgi:hypothetical protein
MHGSHWPQPLSVAIAKLVMQESVVVAGVADLASAIYCEAIVRNDCLLLSAYLLSGSEREIHAILTSRRIIEN